MKTICSLWCVLRTCVMSFPLCCIFQSCMFGPMILLSYAISWNSDRIMSRPYWLNSFFRKHIYGEHSSYLFVHSCVAI